MAYAYKRYRIEDGAAEDGGASVTGSHADRRIDEILATVREMKSTFQPLRRSAGEVIEAYRKEIAGVLTLRTELETMKSAIQATKQDIGSLSFAESRGLGMRRVACELDAVSESTESAATAILGSIEEIERQIEPLRADDPAGRQAALDVVCQRIVALYEACNFQDLTGQRIAKIVDVMKFVEERLDNMIASWADLEVLKDFVGDQDGRKSGHLLNGPALAGDPDHVSQTDIDSLFA